MMNPTPVEHARLLFVSRVSDNAQEIAGAIRQIDLRAAEEPEAGAVRRRQIETLATLVAAALDLLTETADAFDECDDEPAMAIGDVAAIARMTLREKQALLARIESESDAWAIVDRCDRAARAVAKAMFALEQALASTYGFAPRIEIVDECARGVRVRAAYAKFRTAVRQIADRAASMPLRVRAAATALAILTGRDEYDLMRVSDRRLLRSLQQRARAWLADDTAPAGEGEHIWQEMLAVSSLLMQINGRAELVAHDEAMLRTLCTSMRNGASIERVWPDVLTLRGLDATLDRMLDDPRAVEPSAWRECLCHLHALRSGADAGSSLAGLQAAAPARPNGNSPHPTR